MTEAISAKHHDRTAAKVLARFKSSAHRVAVSVSLAVVMGCHLAVTDARAEDTRRAFILQNRCALSARLGFLLSLSDKVKKDRFIIVSPQNRDDHYVQCLYYDRNTMVICEVASGFFTRKAGGPPLWRLDESVLQQVESLGFDRDASSGNHRLRRSTATHGPDALADLMLTALHDIFEARLATPLEITAPLAVRARFKPRCQPTS